MTFKDTQGHHYYVWFGVHPRSLAVSPLYGAHTISELQRIILSKVAYLTYRNCIWPMSIVAKRLDGSRCHLVWRYRL